MLAEAATERRRDVERGRALLDAAAAEFVAAEPFAEGGRCGRVGAQSGEALSDDSGTSDESD